jgi:carbon starvation protein
MLYAPMFIMLAVTFTALCFTIQQKSAKLGAGTFSFNADGLQLIFAILLLALGIMVAVQGVRKLAEKKPAVA